MNQTTMVFRRSTGIHTYPCELAEEAAALHGERLANDSPEVWGEFLYARDCRARPLVLDTAYEFKVRQELGQLNYRKEGDEVYLPLHYLRMSGPHRDTLCFPLSWRDKATGATCHLDTYFAYARTFKFKDMCEDRGAVFVLQGNRPMLELRNRFTGHAEYLIPLDTQQ